MSDVTKKVVVLAGATGALGGMIGRALLDTGDVTLRCLVRPGSGGKLGALASAGAEIVESALDAGSAAALEAACAGAYSVVSAVQGGPDVIVDAQLVLLRAAASAGVRRFIPSDFSYNLFNLAEGENINSDWRRRFAAEARRERGAVELVHVLNGCFLDRGVLFGFLGAIDLQAMTARLWGDGDALMDFTTYADTALYTAEAARDPEALPEHFNVAGDVLTFHELVRAYEEASGKALSVQKLGTLADLDVAIDAAVKADPGNIFGYLPNMYWRAMLNGKGKLGPLSGARYPHIKPATVKEYVLREGL
jgi:nucleoside-diphosphate-sugar epimerase